MRAEQPAILEREDELHHAVLKAHDVAARHLAEARDADLVAFALLARLRLRQADR